MQSPSSENTPPDDTILLSPYSKALIAALESVKKKYKPPDAPKISVSQTVSFFSILYEKARNAIEFREEHLVRRAAIERILNRRLSMNPTGNGEAENLIRELLWARYLPNESITENEVHHLQLIIDKYIYLRRKALVGCNGKTKALLDKFIMDFLSCELEEELNPDVTERRSAHLYYFFQVLKNKIQIEGLQREDIDSYFYAAAERAYAKSDKAYTRYHLFQLMYGCLSTKKQDELDVLAVKLPETVDHIEAIMKNEYHEKLTRFAKRHVPPFLILFAIAEHQKSNFGRLARSKSQLSKRVNFVCRHKYQEASVKLKKAAIRGIVYIFLTKAIFALILEFPLSQLFYGSVDLFPLIINTLFPPVLMGVIVLFVRVPGESNTKRIYDRIIDILNRDPTFEKSTNKFSSKTRVKRPVLILGFTLFYLFTFWVTFSLLYYILDILGFNLISKAIFVFFVSLVAFFGYRIRQTTKEYTLENEQSIFTPVIDFFFIPIVFVGKFLSQEVARLNIFILIFDFMIEAPFKLISEIVEEWINFVRARKEEII